MSDQIQNQVLSVVADALEALNRRVEGFEAALNTSDSNVLEPIIQLVCTPVQRVWAPVQHNGCRL